MADQDAAYQEAVAFLQKTNLQGESVYEQLAAVVGASPNSPSSRGPVWVGGPILTSPVAIADPPPRVSPSNPTPSPGKILDEKPSDAVDVLETSIMAKKTAYRAPDPPTLSSDPKNVARAVALKQLYSTPKPKVNMSSGEVEDTGNEPADFETENLVADAAMFEAAGVGLSAGEMYGVMLAIKRLGENEDNKVETARFFGKILGTGADYYVFETHLKEKGEEKDPSEGEIPAEASGEAGANYYTYWVCNYLGGPFTKLPDCEPTTIKVARQIKKYFTGDLDAAVVAYPPFPGTEKDFLRAQIGRIASATVVCPLDYFKLAEDDGAEGELPKIEGDKKSEEYEAKAAAEMLNLENWCHRYHHIKPQGRCKFYEPELPEPDPEADEDQIERPEPEVSPPLLETLNNDGEKTPSEVPDWGFAIAKPAADDSEDTPPPETRPAWATCTSTNVLGVQYPVVAVKSIKWPGAAAVYSEVGRKEGGVPVDARFSNIYVGYGFENVQFEPPAPPKIEEEYDLGGGPLDPENPEPDTESKPKKMVMATDIPDIPPEPENEEEETPEE